MGTPSEASGEKRRRKRDRLRALLGISRPFFRRRSKSNGPPAPRAGEAPPIASSQSVVSITLSPAVTTSPSPSYTSAPAHVTYPSVPPFLALTPAPAQDTSISVPPSVPPSVPRILPPTAAPGQDTNVSVPNTVRHTVQPTVPDTVPHTVPSTVPPTVSPPGTPPAASTPAPVTVPTPQEPTTEEATTEEPTTEEATSEDTSTEEATSGVATPEEEPTPEETAPEEPAPEKPTPEESAPEEPATEQISLDLPQRESLRVWGAAYQQLKSSDETANLVAEYEIILKKFEPAAARLLDDGAVNKRLQAMEIVVEKAGTCKSGDKAAEAAGVTLSVLDEIRSTVAELAATNPVACFAWAGFCVITPVSRNPSRSSFRALLCLPIPPCRTSLVRSGTDTLSIAESACANQREQVCERRTGPCVRPSQMVHGACAGASPRELEKRLRIPRLAKRA